MVGKQEMHAWNLDMESWCSHHPLLGLGMQKARASGAHRGVLLFKVSLKCQPFSTVVKPTALILLSFCQPVVLGKEEKPKWQEKVWTLKVGVKCVYLVAFVLIWTCNGRGLEWQNDVCPSLQWISEQLQSRLESWCASTLQSYLCFPQLELVTALLLEGCGWQVLHKHGWMTGSGIIMYWMRHIMTGNWR